MCVLNTKMVTPFLTCQWEGMLISGCLLLPSPRQPPSPSMSPCQGQFILCLSPCVTEGDRHPLSPAQPQPLSWPDQ